MMKRRKNGAPGREKANPRKWSEGSSTNDLLLYLYPSKLVSGWLPMAGHLHAAQLDAVVTIREEESYQPTGIPARARPSCYWLVEMPTDSSFSVFPAIHSPIAVPETVIQLSNCIPNELGQRSRPHGIKSAVLCACGSETDDGISITGRPGAKNPKSSELDTGRIFHGIGVCRKSA